MLVYCPVACGECNKQCKDFHLHCPTWAQLGQCDSNPEYMNIYCPMTCKKCSGGKTCADQHEHCVAWAGSGHCTNDKYKAYMKMRCPKVCGFC